jgi:hypothetical protein
MIIHTYQKSKKRKNTTAKERELRTSWEQLLSKYTPKKSVNTKVEAWKPAKSFVRETPKIPSLNSHMGVATKPIQGKVYTGSAMIGIGTLHKSNAVPIFSTDDAKDQASMRR